MKRVPTSYSLLLTSIILLFPLTISAFQIFSPFGGKVKKWLPDSPGCAPITKAISVATLGSVNITVEELSVGGPKESTVGILRVNSFLVPGLTTIYKHKSYKIPGTWVIGNSINVCSACDKIEDIPVLKQICKLGPVEKILDIACDIVASSCPITNLVYKMGTGLPSLGK